VREALLDVKEVSGLLHVHAKTIYDWKTSNKLPSITVNGRVRFEQRQIDEFLKRGRSRFADPSPLSAKVVIDLDNFDRLHLRSSSKGGSAVGKNSRRRWNYGFGSIFLRKTREGKDRWSIDYQDKGKRVREVVGDAQARGEALVALQSRVAESFNGRLNPVRKAEPMRFARFAETYLEDYAKANKKSWVCDSYALKAHLVPYFGGLKLEEITPLMIEQYKTARRKSVRESSTNREIALLKVMFNLAMAWGFASENPVLKVKMYSERGNIKERVLTDEEEARLLAAAAPHLRPIILGLLNTGARRNELLTLTWDRVDLERRTVRLVRLKAGQNPVMPLNERAHEVLTALKAEAKSDCVFTGPNGRRLTTIRHSFENACRRAGLKGLRLHDLRHTFATRLIRRGVDIVTVQSLLGHVSVVMTQRYTHTNEDQRRDAVARLELPRAEMPGTLARDGHTEPPVDIRPPVNQEYSVH
jgi:excisionase family DNA binding protein